MSVWTDPRTWVAGDEVSAAILNTHVAEELLFLYNRTQGGTITIVPSASGVQTSIDVEFLVPFLKRPYVYIGYHGGSPGTGSGNVSGVGADHESETGFRATLTRNSTTSTTLNWIAVEQEN